METEVLGMIGKELAQEKHNGLVLMDGVEAAAVYLMSVREKNRKIGKETRVAMSSSASECFKKAAYMLDVEVVSVPADKDGRMQVSALRQVISQVSGVVASMGSNLLGSVDDVKAIHDLALSYRVGLHIDCGPQGMLVLFKNQEKKQPSDSPSYQNYPTPDFSSFPGMTSIALNMSQHGLAMTGASLLFFRSPLDRQSTYVPLPDWQGGLYITPTMYGSKSSLPMASAWLALMSQGRQGYEDQGNQLEHSVSATLKGIKNNHFVEFKGGLATVSISRRVSFKKDKLSSKKEKLSFKKENLFMLQDQLDSMGWKLEATRNPDALVLRVTMHNQEKVVKSFAQDVNSAVGEVIKSGYKHTANEGMHFRLWKILERCADQEKLTVFLRDKIDITLKL